MSRLGRWASACLLSLLVIVAPDVASAATAAMIYGPAGSLTVTCTTSPCANGTATVKASVSASAVADGLSADPRTLAGWPSPTLDAINAVRTYAGGSATPSGGVATWTMQLSVYQSAPTTYVVVFPTSCATGAPCAVTSAWAEDPAAGTATTSAAPTSTAPATTTAAPTSTAPATTTAAPTSTAPATTSGTTSGSTSSTTDPGAGGSTSPPPASGSAPTVVTLSDGQWADVRLGLGVLVFFSAAGFVVALRAGR